MRLFHGTSRAAALEILRTGLMPRQTTGASSWEDTAPSNEECVYLTSAYPGYYAWEVCGGEREHWAILEIDVTKLDETLLRPDEDFLEMDSRGRDDVNGDVLQRTRHYSQRLVENRERWRDSVDQLGTCAYQGAVPTTAIASAIAFDPKANLYLQDAAGLLKIGLEEHSRIGEKHARITGWFFGGDLSGGEVDSGWEQRESDERKVIEDLLQTRAGVTVLG